MEKYPQPLPQKLVDIAKQYDIDLIRDIVYCEDNSGYSSDYIGLGNFDDADIEVIAFFHELAHILMYNRICNDLQISHQNMFSLCELSNEGMAWEYAILLAKKHGYTYDDFDCKELKYARNCLKSYIDSEVFKIEFDR